jgi:hypothetical protein
MFPAIPTVSLSVDDSVFAKPSFVHDGAGDKRSRRTIWQSGHDKLKADKKLIVSKYLELTELFNRAPSADAASANPFDRLCKRAKTVLLPTGSRLFILSFRKCDKPSSVAPRSDGSTR